MDETCEVCGARTRGRITQRGLVYFVDQICDECGHVDFDEEGGL